MPAIIEREKISPSMQKALHRHIMREREKRKQEAAEAEKDFERKAKEEEEKRKKLEEEHSTLEDIKDELAKLMKKQESLRQEKHNLFWQFKKVLHEEDKHKARLREQSELNQQANNQYQQHGMPVNPHHMLPQGLRYQTHSAQQSAYLRQPVHSNPANHLLQQGIKRSHSPTLPSSGLMQMFRPQISMRGSPQHKYEGNFPGHSPYMTPSHGGSSFTHNSPNSSSHTPTGRMQSNYPQGHGNASGDRANPGIIPYQSASGKSHEDVTFVDDRSRPRITMIPSNHAPSPFSTGAHMRSNSPGRYHVKTEKDRYSPGGQPPPHKYQSIQSNSRTLYPKHQ